MADRSALLAEVTAINTPARKDKNDTPIWQALNACHLQLGLVWRVDASEPEQKEGGGCVCCWDGHEWKERTSAGPVHPQGPLLLVPSR